MTHYDYDHFNGMSALLGADDSGFSTRIFLGPLVMPSLAASKYEPGTDAYEELMQIDKRTWASYKRSRHPKVDVLWFERVYPSGVLR